MQFFLFISFSLEAEEALQVDDTPSESPEKKPLPPACSSCKKFLKHRDPHSQCILCRPCSPENPCPLDKDWSPEQWQPVMAKRQEKADKARGFAAADLEKILSTMASVASRLSALESKAHKVIMIYLSVRVVSVCPSRLSLLASPRS